MATMNSSSFKKFKFELGVSENLANFLHWKENKIEFKLEKEIKKFSIFLAQKIPTIFSEEKIMYGRCLICSVKGEALTKFGCCNL